MANTKRCTTHHYACDCREERHKKAEEAAQYWEGQTYFAIKAIEAAPCTCPETVRIVQDGGTMKPVDVKTVHAPDCWKADVLKQLG